VWHPGVVIQVGVMIGVLLEDAENARWRLRMVQSPVEICRGTNPSQAAKSRPLENTSPVPIAATVAIEMIGPIHRRAGLEGLSVPRWPSLTAPITGPSISNPDGRCEEVVAAKIPAQLEMR
jgi:hypothetical protein